jgi:hypothetical protein
VREAGWMMLPKRDDRASLGPAMYGGDESVGPGATWVKIKEVNDISNLLRQR